MISVTRIAVAINCVLYTVFCTCTNILCKFILQALAELSNGASKEADSLEVLQMNSNGDSSSCASSDALSAEFVKVDLEGSNGASGVAATPAEATATTTRSSAEQSARSKEKESSPPSASAAPAPLSRAQLLVLIARLKSLLHTQWPSVREHHCACVTPRLTSKCVCSSARPRTRTRVQYTPPSKNLLIASHCTSLISQYEVSTNTARICTSPLRVYTYL